MAIIENVTMCKLGGYEGSNPEIWGSFPPLEPTITVEDQQEFLDKSLPTGAEPGLFTSNRIRNIFIVAYTFSRKSAEQGVRDDLASISVIISDKKVNIEQFEILFKEIIAAIGSEIANIPEQVLLQMMERIYNGVNSKGKIKIDKVTADLSSIISKKKIHLEPKDPAEFKGGF
jgi:hypothetical protein